MTSGINGFKVKSWFHLDHVPEINFTTVPTVVQYPVD